MAVSGAALCTLLRALDERVGRLNILFSLQAKLLVPTNVPIADFLARAPDPPAFLVTRTAVTLLKVGLSSLIECCVHFRRH